MSVSIEVMAVVSSDVRTVLNINFLGVGIDRLMVG
jgi:hypothetical protein